MRYKIIRLILRWPFELLYVIFGTMAKWTYIAFCKLFKIEINLQRTLFRRSVVVEEYWDGYYAFYKNAFDYFFWRKELRPLRTHWHRTPEYCD